MTLVKDNLTDMKTELSSESCQCGGRYWKVFSATQVEPSVVANVCAYCRTIKFLNLSTAPTSASVDIDTAKQMLTAEYLLSTDDKIKAEIMSIVLGMR